MGCQGALQGRKSKASVLQLDRFTHLNRMIYSGFTNDELVNLLDHGDTGASGELVRRYIALIELLHDSGLETDHDDMVRSIISANHKIDRFDDMDSTIEEQRQTIQELRQELKGNKSSFDTLLEEIEDLVDKHKRLPL